MVAGFGKIHASIILVDVPQMPDRVSYRERIALRAVEGEGFLIMLPRGIAAMEVPLNLAQVCERLRQLDWDASVATQGDSLDQVAFGIFEPILSSRQKGLR